MNKAINGKRRALRLGTGIATCVSTIVLAHSAFGQSLPELANAGGANVSTSGNTMTVDALAADKVINWGTFSVAQNNTVNFVSTDGVGGAVATPVTVINRVIGKDVGGTNTFFPSIIDGRINSTSNIALWLINPSGVMFGPSGSFNGGSLVVSTLDFASGTGSQVFGAGDRTSALNSRNVVIDPASALGAVELKLETGPGTLTSSGSVLLLGEQVTVGKSLTAQGDVYIVAASDVRITSQAGSPVGFNFAAGTRLNGAQVLASGNVQGRNIVVAASNGTSTIANLLQVDVGGQLTATADGGGVTLLTTANPTAMETATGANIVSEGRLRTLGLVGDISVTSNADVSVARADATGDILVRSGSGATNTLTAGTVQAGGNLELRSTGDMTLGVGAADVIQAGGTATIRSTGAIGRGAVPGTLAIRSHADSSLANGALFIQATGDALLGNAALAAGSTGTAAATVLSNTGAITLGSAIATRFSGSAATTFAATGAISADNSALVPAGTALSISAAGGITLNTARTTGVDQDISLSTTGAFEATSVTASRNLTIGSSTSPALSITAGSLTATDGTITASAGSMEIGTATAGLSIGLRSDGDVEVTTAGTSGNTLPSGNFSVSGLTGARAASFTGGIINSRTGSVNIQADTQTVSSVRAATNATLSGTTGITLGSADVGGNLLVTTAGDITLGTTGAQSMLADGRVTITSTAGAIGRGAGSTALTIRSNDGDVAPADALAITGRNAVALGNAALFGGTTGSASVSVESLTADVTIGSARGSSITGRAATTFTASGAILADSATALVGNTISITGLTGLDLQTVRTAGTGENIVLTSNGPISATTLAARNNLTVASLANPASSLTATSMTAQAGSINAFAQSMNVGAMNAGQAINLRSNGAIEVTGAAIAGTNLSVSGISGANALSFTAGTAEATGGNVDVRAVTTDIGTTRAGEDVAVSGTNVTLGNVTAGLGGTSGSYTVNATGLVTLGKADNQRQTALDAVSITGGTIVEGATGLVITSDSGGAGARDLEVATLTGPISLGTTTLNGGPARQSAVDVDSSSQLALGAVNGLSVTLAGNGALGDVIIERLTTGTGAALITATRDASIDRVTAGGDYTVNAARNITLGFSGSQVQSAVGAISITSTGGSISQGMPGVTLTSDSDGNGVGSLMLSAPVGAISITTLNGGPARQAAISLNSGSHTTIGTANGLSFTSTTGAAGDVFIEALNTGTGAALVTAGRAATIGNVNAGGDYTVSAAGLVTLGLGDNARQSAAGNVSITSTGGSILAGGTGLIVTSNSDGAGGGTMLLDAQGANGALSLAGATLNGGTTAERTDVTLKAVGGITLANINSGALTTTARDFESTGQIRAAGDALFTLSGLGTINGIETTGTGSDITIGAASVVIGSGRSSGDYSITTSGAGGVTLGQVAGQAHSAAGALTIIANGGGSILQGFGADNLTLTANSDGVDGGAMLLDATGNIGLGATLNGGTAAQRTAVTLLADGTIGFASANSAAFTADAGGSFLSTGTITAAGPAMITAVGEADVNRITTTGTGNGIAITAQTARIGQVSSAADYTVDTTFGDIILGNGANQTQSAVGAIRITTASGSIRQGDAVLGNRLTLLSNSAGTGTGAIELTASGGSIELPAIVLNGGPAQQSGVTLNALGSVQLARVNSANFTSQSTGGFTASGPVSAIGSVSIRALNGISLHTVTAEGAGHDISLVSNEAISANRITAARNVTVSGPAAARATSFTADTVSAGTGSVDVKATTIDISGVSAGVDMLADGNTVAIGSVTAGRDYRISADGNVTLGKSSFQTQAAGGAISIVSTGGSIARGANANSLTLTSNSDGAGGGDMLLDAQGAAGAITLDTATLNGGTMAQRTAVTLRSVTDTVVANTNSAALTATARDFTSTGNIMAVGDATITASRNASVNAIETIGAGSDIGITAASAQIGIADSAGNYTVTTSGAGGVTLGESVGQTHVAAGAISITANGGGSITRGADSLTLTSNADGVGGGSLLLDAAGGIALAGATLNGGTGAQRTAVTLDAGTDIRFANANSAAFTASAGGDFTSNGAIIAAGVAGITAGDAASINAIETTGAGNGITVNAASASIGRVTSAGSYAVTATGAVVLGNGAGQVQTARGGITINGASISESATGLTLTSDSDGSGGDALALTTTTGAIALGNATLNGGPARQSAITLASGTTTTIGAANGRLVTVTGDGLTANREISAATDITVTVDGPVALMQGANAVEAIRLSATDAMIGGAVDARTIDITNSGSGNLVIGGTAASETGKFVLSRTETAQLRATEALTLGADGSDNVEIRQVDFTVPQTVRVLANGRRIDITGRITFDADTTLKLGGSTAANSIIRLQTGTGGTGGAIVSNGGVLELTAASIVAGTQAFANDLQAVSGAGSVTEAARLNLTPGSSLYNNVGGTGETMIDVGAMKVSFSNFAMFQNTSDAALSLLSTGVKLGTGSQQTVALDIQSGASQPVFAMFGSINGVINIATSLLGNPPLAHYDNISASRINGCLIGGGNCQSVQNLTPSLTALDNIRTSIFTVKPDFQVPFDPLVGTNNDALFDDVGSFGLGELPMTPIECSDPNGACEVKKGGN